MRTTFLIIFILTGRFAFGQTIEQKAINYLVNNLKDLSIKYQSGQFNFNIDSNRVWYYPKVIGEKKRKNIKLENGLSSYKEQFYQIIHDDKDILITVYANNQNRNACFVKFDIFTNYDNKTSCNVYFDNTMTPIKLEQNKN